MKLTRNPAASSGFTLVELLVLMACTIVLVAMLLPAMAHTRPGSQGFVCLNNVRRQTLAWLMYNSDNADNFPVLSSWVYQVSYLDWTPDRANTNTAPLLDPTVSTVASYVQSAAIWRCPADNYLCPAQIAARMAPRARSYSMNGALGGSPIPINQTGRVYFKATKSDNLNTPGPAMVFSVLDEHADSINDYLFLEDPGYAAGSERWRDLPASYHNGAACISFADGHAESHKWQDAGTLISVYYVQWSAQTSGTGSGLYGKIYLHNFDYEWLTDRMPYQ